MSSSLRSSATCKLLMTMFLLLLLVVPSRAAVAAAAVSKFMVPSLPGYPGGYLPFKLETGYIGVGDLDQVQLFYYFIESERDPKRDPLMLWLTGGPGCCGFSGLAFEIDAQLHRSVLSAATNLVKLNKDNFRVWKGMILPFLRGNNLYRFVDGSHPCPAETLLGVVNPEYAKWIQQDQLVVIVLFSSLSESIVGQVANIIFLDSPVGTGFSYATTSAAYDSDDTLASSHLYEFLRKWLIDHPEFIKNNLYIAGDSYGGKMTPILVSKILHGNKHGSKPHMNIKGYSIGNPVTYEEMDINSRVEYAFRVSLLSTNLYECMNFVDLVNVVEPGCPLASPRHKYDEASTDYYSNNAHYGSLSTLLTDHHRRLSLPPDWWCRNDNYLASYVWANQESVRKSLHVRTETVDVWARCNTSISYTKDIASVVDYHQSMTNKTIRALVYSGDQDMAIPYVGTLKWIQSLDVPLTTVWRPWFVDGQVAGYTKKHSNVNYDFTYATVKGAGHTAPEYKPKQCLAMIIRWFAGFSL